MNILQAIDSMKFLSERDKTFSLTFSTWNREKKSSTGIHYVRNASIVHQSKNSKSKYRKYQLFIYDYDEARYINVWIPLILFFNETKIID